MKRKRIFDLTEAQKDKIISAAYGNGSLSDRLIVRRLIFSNEEAKKFYLSYKQTASEVKQIAEEECPSDILKTVQQKTKRVLENKGSFMSDLYSAVFSRPIVSAVTTVVLIASIVIALIVNRPVQYNYTQAQIIDADRQAREAFLIVGKILKETHATLQNDVLGERVSKPLNQSIRIANKLFEGEKK